MGLRTPLSNTQTQVKALQALIRRLPSLSDPLPVRPPRSLHRRAKQLKDQEAHELVAAYEAGATVYELSRQFGIARYGSRILVCDLRLGGVLGGHE